MIIVTEIEIFASPRRIWGILTNFERAPEWNPFINKIEGELKARSKLSVSLNVAGSVGIRVQPHIISARPFSEIRCLYPFLFPGILDSVHVLSLRPLDDHRTLFVQADMLEGILLPVLWKSLESRLTEGLRRMNSALKKRAENKNISKGENNDTK